MEEAKKHVADRQITVQVCRAKSCTKRGAGELARGLEETFARKGISAQVLRHDCFDLCKQACNVLVEMPDSEPRIYTQLHPRYAEKFAESLVEELQEKTLAATGD